MFGAIAWGALWRPLELIYFLICTTGVLRWGSKKLQKHVKINGLGRFRGTHLGGPIWAKSVPMQRGARFQLFRSVPMQRGVHSGARNVTKIMVLESGHRGKEGKRKLICTFMSISGHWKTCLHAFTERIRQDLQKYKGVPPPIKSPNN